MIKEDSKSRGIREGLTLLISECYSRDGSACELHPVFQPQVFLNKLFPYFHSHGVVIKEEGELPDYPGDSAFDKLLKSDIYLNAQDDMFKAGYTKWSPLI